jgi:23S rRNA (uracil1939-C5)-methyltransferase
VEVKKNDILEIDISSISHDGFGVGRYENFVIFTPACAEGEKIKAKIIYIKKNMAYAQLEQVINASPSRINPDCDVFSQCGGCVFRHISYRQELIIKQKRVKEALEKIGHINIEPEPIIGCNKINRYRNKAQYPVAYDNKLLIGFYAQGSHRIISCKSCLLQPKSFENLLNVFEQWIINNNITIYDEDTGKGILRHIYIRQAEATGEMMVCAVINGDDIPKRQSFIEYITKNVPQIVSIILNINKQNTNVILGDKCKTIWGKDTITDILCGLKIEISPLSFYQVNRAQAELLYNIVAEFAQLTGDEILLDLYCGTGTIGLSMAHRAKKVIGVEVVSQAVENARVNAEINNIANAAFTCADAEEAAHRFISDGLKIDVIVIDPPRKGCTPETIDAIVKMQPQKVIYVSCDPATLSRDLNLFEQNNYKCVKVQPVDMFARTSHVETVVLMYFKGKV